MRKLLKLAFLGYIIAGLHGLYRESKGEVVCTCADDCWCKKPGLNVFRWVFPYGHKDR